MPAVATSDRANTRTAEAEWKGSPRPAGKSPFSPWAPEVFGEQIQLWAVILAPCCELSLGYESFAAVVSTLTPGPIVDETTTFFRYLPLDDDGLARSSSSITAEKFFCKSA